jgi:phosphatidylinositol alpha-1,6-mannosyltransferase
MNLVTIRHERNPTDTQPIVSAVSPDARRRQEPVRVLLMATSFFPRLGGLEIFLEKTVERLAEICEVGLVTRSQHWIPGEAAVAHFPIHLDDSATPTVHRRLVERQLAAIVRRFTPDLVHFGSARASIYRYGLPASIPCCATVHGNDLTDARPMPGQRDPTPLIVDALNACHRVFPVSRHTSILCRQWGVVTPRTVLTPGCDLDFFQPLPVLGEEARAFHGITPGVPVLLTVSRMVARKGHRTVLEALRRLPFPTHWLVVGDGPCREEIQSMTRDLGLTDQVTFLGRTSDDDLLALYNACDIFVLTPEEHRWDKWLDSEGFGLVFHEAGACAKPVIGSNTSGCCEAVHHNVSGILVPPGDPVSLAQALTRIVLTPSLAQRLGEGGLRMVHKLGGWSRLARQLQFRYRQILR